MQSPHLTDDCDLPGRLHYSSDEMPGLTREPKGSSFRFLDASGKPISDKKVLERLQKLVIPPAWKNVWICTSPNGHLQVTGRDERGRKQAIYHSDWSEFRAGQKFDHLKEFGRTLPKIRKRVEAEIRRPGLSKEKVLAAVVQLLESTMIRIGNDRYANENKSFGLTTLRNRHAKVVADRVEFQFIGKSKKPFNISVKNRTLSGIVRRCQELPGQHLFSYIQNDGDIHLVNSTDVNRFLQDISEAPLTAKDFRTWGGTIEAVRLMREVRPSTPRELSKVVSEVAKKLGNTVSVCRQHYIHPKVIEFNPSAPWLTAPLPRSRRYLSGTEVLFLDSILE